MNNNEKYSLSYGGQKGSRHNDQLCSTRAKYTSQITITTALKPKLPYDRTRKPRLTFFPPSLSLSLSPFPYLNLLYQFGQLPKDISRTNL